jgi:HlyD family type I secretion membrane fusion protein
MLDAPRSSVMPLQDSDPHDDARRAIRFGIGVIAVGVLASGVWAATAPLFGAVVAPGTVKVDLNRKTVQHQEGGLVKEVLVRDGQRVAAGEPLIILGDVAVDAGLDMLRVQLVSERARAARLEAERAMAPKLVYPTDVLMEASDPRIAEVLAKETSLYASRRAALDGQIALLRDQIKQAVEEVAALGDQVSAEADALRLQREELVANEALVQQGYVTKTRILALQRAVSEYEARHSEHRSEQAKSKQKITDLELRILAQRDTYTQNAANELKQSTSRIHELEQRVRPSQDAAKRQEIVAPVAGEVVELKFTARGMVIGPRDPILDIVPADPRLVIEARIRTEDVSYVKQGSEVDIRFTAFKYRTTPLVAGHVFYVSADRLVDRATNQPYYATLIEADPRSLRSAGDLPIQAGMPAEVFVRTEARTPLEYFLEPVTAYLRRGLREP